jgi:hypothetical protein
VLLQAAEQSGVQFCINDGQIRAIGPCEARKLLDALMEHEADLVEVLGSNWATESENATGPR